MRPIFAGLLLLIAVIPPVGPTVSAQGQDVDPKIAQLVSAVSQERLVAILKKLESFETRATLSSTDSPTHGIGAARQWIFDEMKSYSPRLQVSFDTYQVAAQGRLVRPAEIRNVLAILPGRSSRRIYISGHYDTIANVGGQGAANTSATASRNMTGDPNAPVDDPAPGVNDDGSGTALTMELARVLSQSGIEFDATLVFMCHAAEEMAHFGAVLHAQKMLQQKVPIDAVLNHDIVGGDTGGNGIIDGATVRVYSQGPEDSPSRELARFVQRWGARYVPSHKVRLMARQDRYLRGGDHEAYNRFGFAAVGFREARENYTKQHEARDTFDGVSPPYLTRNARVSLAAAAALAIAPPAPVLVDQSGAPRLSRAPSGYDANLSWTASPGATNYRVFWREAWGPDWQHEMLVGNVTNVVFPNLQIDDHIFGVAAVDAAGHESLVSVYPDPPYPDTPVRTLP